MTNLIAGLIFLSTFVPSSNLDKCQDVNQFHPVKSDIMLQLVLKSYGYYDGKIDGKFGNISKKALISFQNTNNIEADGIVGTQTCQLLLNKKQILKKISIVSQASNLEQDFSQDIYDAQEKLKQLGLYTSQLDGLNGPGTKRALRNFQTKAGLIPDAVLGPLTKSALEKGEDSYVVVNVSTPTVDTESNSGSSVDQSSALDLRNYDTSKQCIVGYVDSNGIWVPDPCFKPVFDFF